MLGELIEKFKEALNETNEELIRQTMQSIENMVNQLKELSENVTKNIQEGLEISKKTLEVNEKIQKSNADSQHILESVNETFKTMIENDATRYGVIILITIIAGVSITYLYKRSSGPIKELKGELTEINKSFEIMKKSIETTKMLNDNKIQKILEEQEKSKYTMYAIMASIIAAFPYLWRKK